MEAKNGITEQIESDNLQYLLALLSTASYTTSHAGPKQQLTVATCAKPHIQCFHAYSASRCLMFHTYALSQTQKSV